MENDGRFLEKLIIDPNHTSLDWGDALILANILLAALGQARKTYLNKNF